MEMSMKLTHLDKIHGDGHTAFVPFINIPLQINIEKFKDQV
jgi:hypothetical protein